MHGKRKADECRFQHHQALRLKLTELNPSDSLFRQGAGGRKYDGQQQQLHTEFVDDANNVRRMYMTKFCSAKCRNRSNYLQKKQESISG